jgi:hypothetical protein
MSENRQNPRHARHRRGASRSHDGKRSFHRTLNPETGASHQRTSANNAAGERANYREIQTAECKIACNLAI